MTKTQCSSEIETQAKYWLWRIEEGLSQQERQTFVAWVNQNNNHHLALHKFSPSLKMSKILTEFNGLFPLEQKHSNKYRTVLSQFSLAASVIFFCIIASEMFLKNNLPSLFKQTNAEIVNKEYSTKKGEQAQFSLPDGSLVHLNTDSLLAISFSEGHRQLELIKGEALFDVAKDKSRPFSVTSGEQSFTALGTIFNVQKNDSTHLELIVTEGRVLIADADEPLNKLTQKITKNGQVSNNKSIVEVGEKATIINNVQLPKTKFKEQALHQELAWRKGELIFLGESLEEALSEISRYANVSFTIVDEELANEQVAGYFKTGDVDALLNSISVNFDLNYTKTTDNRVLISKAPISIIQTEKYFNTQ
jgi:transmembrane sensor